MLQIGQRKPGIHDAVKRGNVWLGGIKFGKPGRRASSTTFPKPWKIHSSHPDYCPGGEAERGKATD
ncbi:predicted protein [Plenodomus lingam JN3]|uniref:Predicted protein n=1 Tax=Leptosphaeria maculans (strain JN3 / isolate v23.1.3 / race Av1-4-5-6-7-8) TaxID=985895 RepID=E5A107_LEPMJ|nr:predicted protein [Plenodomus lingam JN3]CBX97303.1 predicted protein [Plenodomus lingam JN3]